MAGKAELQKHGGRRLYGLKRRQRLEKIAPTKRRGCEKNELLIAFTASYLCRHAAALIFHSPFYFTMFYYFFLFLYCSTTLVS